MSAEIENISSIPPSKVFTKRSVVALSTNAIRLVKSNPSRVALYVTNNETINVRIDETEAPTATQGFPLDAAGGVISLNIITDGDLPTKEWFAIADSGTPSVRVKELVRRPKELV